MTSDFELAFRRMLKEVVQEVAAELLRTQRISEISHSRESVQSGENLLMTTHEAAKQLAISVPTLERMKRAGTLPYVRLGRSVRYSVEAIQQWIRDSGSTNMPSSKVVSPKEIRVATSQTVERKESATKPSPEEPQQHKAKLALRRKVEKPVSTPNKSGNKKAAQVEDRHNPFAELLKEIGIQRDSLPSFTNGELMKIAEVDMATYHGWMYLNRQLPEEARAKLQSHFRAFLANNDMNRNE